MRVENTPPIDAPPPPPVEEVEELLEDLDSAISRLHESEDSGNDPEDE